jgi:hypothetical protein
LVAGLVVGGLAAALDRLGRRLRYKVGVHEVVLRGACPECRTG